jgi:hypothetical protein
MEVTMKCSQEEMGVNIGANNDTFEALRGAILSEVGIHQARTETIEEEIRAKMHSNQENTEAMVVDTTRRGLENKFAEVKDYFLLGLEDARCWFKTQPAEVEARDSSIFWINSTSETRPKLRSC